jgi:Tfp pilus assembly protein PilO
MRYLFPVILAIAAIGLFVVFTNPTYKGLKGAQAKVGAYNDALDKSQELRGLRDKLLSARSTFSPQDEQKLTRLLPDQVDNIRLIIDINNIAARRGLVVSNVSLGEVSKSSSAATNIAVGPSSDPVGSVSLGFSVTASYEDFLAFLQDMEHSLRILDIERLAFAQEQGGKYTFNITLRTYWLH